MFNKLAALLSGNKQLSLTPSPERSALIQSLMARSMQPQGAKSPIEGLAIAAKPILAAVLARREGKARMEERTRQKSLAEALAGQLSRANRPGAQGEAARMAALMTSGAMPENPLAQSILGAQAQQAFSPGANRSNAVTEFGKINQDESAGNISSETADFMRDAARKQDARSIGDAETSLRKEFNDQMSGFASGLQSLENARNLLSLEDNPVGAQAALTAFVKAIDNSVVRPSEQAMYQNIFGLAQSIENRLGQLRGEGAFGPESKADILNAVNALAASAEEYIQRGTAFYSDLALGSGLNAYHVTGFAPKTGGRTLPSEQKKGTTTLASGPVLSIP